MIEQFKQKIKQNNGFTGQDIIIAMFIIVIFLATFTTIMVNLSNTSAEISKVKRVTETVTQIADRFDALTYDDVQATTGEKNVKDLFQDINLYNNMQATYEVTEISANNQKKIKLKVNYPDVTPVEITIGKKLVEKTGSGNDDGSEDDSNTGTNNRRIVKINTNSQYPFNRPTLNATESSLGYTYGDDEDKTNEAKLKPIKFIWTEVGTTSKKGSWVEVQDYDDLEWYSIEENIWPTFVYDAARSSSRKAYTYMTKTAYTQLQYNPFQKKSGQSLNEYYAMIWIPRIVKDNGNNGYAYAYESENKKIILNNKYVVGTEAILWNTIFHQNSGTYKYQRGLLMSRNNQRTENDENDGWKEYIKYLPEDIQSKIKSINMHINDA